MLTCRNTQEVRMKASADWLQAPYSLIRFDALTSMVAELVEWHESQPSCLSGSEPDWLSVSGNTRVRRHGSAVNLVSVLNQVPDATSSEYEIIFKGERAFSWVEYVWQSMHRDQQLEQGLTEVELPTSCLNELMAFHTSRNTAWLQRFRRISGHESRAEINEVGIVAELDCL